MVLGCFLISVFLKMLVCVGIFFVFFDVEKVMKICYLSMMYFLKEVVKI